MNTFRVAFSMERLVPNTLTSAFDQGYLKNLTETVNYITNNGAWAVLDPHNFGRYYDNIITDVTAFKTFWYNVAKVYANNPRVIFDTNNEYHDMDQNLVFQLNQAAIDGIRSAGATQRMFSPSSLFTYQRFQPIKSPKPKSRRPLQFDLTLTCWKRCYLFCLWGHSYHISRPSTVKAGYGVRLDA
jgi:Endoglucanase